MINQAYHFNLNSFDNVKFNAVYVLWLAINLSQDHYLLCIYIASYVIAYGYVYK